MVEGVLRHPAMPAEEDTLVFTGGRVVTLGAERPVVTAMAIQGRNILAMGGNAQVRALRGPRTRAVDLRGRALLPGLADAHIHLVYQGLSPSWLDLTTCSGVEDILALVRSRVSDFPHGTWLYGRGWDPDRVTGARGPTRAELDAVGPNHPILLSRRDGHLCVANSRALLEAGIGPETPSPLGGEIVRDAAGEPTGELLEMAAIHLAWGRMMDATPLEAFTQAILLAGHQASRQGLTAAHCILLENVPREIEAFRALDTAGRLPLSCYLVPAVQSLDDLHPEAMSLAGRRVRLSGAKIFADGTLFGHTAALRQPYADRPETRGTLNHTLEELRLLVERVRDAGLQPVVHASGDAAVEACLEVFEVALRPDVASWRPRLEHATFLGPDLMERMARMGVIASVQPRHREALERRLGPERAAWASSLRHLLEAEVAVAGGSDGPFVQVGLAPLDDVQALVVQNGLTVEEAWGLFSRGAAFASFTEEKTGRLRPGYLADLVVLEEDPRRVPPDEIGSIPILMTVSQGEVTWEAPGAF